MGLGDSDLSNEKRREGAAPIACSICLEAVTSGRDRSTAKLQCGHEFHLDCIGSAFNAKGVMQCPNCRKVEKGNWLYANGSRSLPEVSMDDWAHDEDLYDYSEMPFGGHWCPFSRLVRLSSSYEEGESSPSLAFQDLLGYHAVFTENSAASSAGHPCPFLTYFQPLEPPSSSNTLVSSESTIEGPPYHHPWSHTPGSSDVQNPHALPAIDLHYRGWDHQSPAYSQLSSRTSGPDHAAISSVAMRTSRLDSDGLPRARSLVHPFILGHGPGSITSLLVPPYLSNTRSQPHVHEHYQHNNSPGSHGGTIFAGGMQRLPGGTRGLPSLGPAPGPAPVTFTAPDQSYYLFPPTSSSNHNRGRGLQDAEGTGGDNFYAWERDGLASFPLLPIDRESGWWGPFPQSTSGSSHSGTSMGSWHRIHGSTERPSSQGRTETSSYRPAHFSRMRPYI